MSPTTHFCHIQLIQDVAFRCLISELLCQIKNLIYIHIFRQLALPYFLAIITILVCNNFSASKTFNWYDHPISYIIRVFYIIFLNSIFYFWFLRFVLLIFGTTWSNTCFIHIKISVNVNLISITIRSPCGTELTSLHTFCIIQITTTFHLRTICS